MRIAPEPRSQPSDAPYWKSIRRHNVFGFDVIVQRDQEEMPLSMDMYQIIKSILPFCSQVIVLTEEQDSNAGSISLRIR
jgi:hypothetical protein